MSAPEAPISSPVPSYERHTNVFVRLGRQLLDALGVDTTDTLYVLHPGEAYAAERSARTMGDDGEHLNSVERLRANTLVHNTHGLIKQADTDDSINYS